MALQTLLKEYTEVTKSPKENKTYSQLQPAKMRPRRKARKYLYAIGAVLSPPLLRQSQLIQFLNEDSLNKDRYLTKISSVRYATSSLAFTFVLVLGGYTRLQGGRWSDSRALSCVERFDTFNQYWTTVSSLHQARSGVGVAVLEGMIYVVGGESWKVFNPKND